MSFAPPASPVLCRGRVYAWLTDYTLNYYIIGERANPAGIDIILTDKLVDIMKDLIIFFSVG